MISPLSVLLALGLDSLLGDPRWLPHPVRWIGSAAHGAERFWAGKLGRTRLAGLAAMVTVLLIFMVGGGALLWAARFLHPGVHMVMSAVILYYSLALRDLAAHGLRVHWALKRDDLPAAREKLSWMVSRETDEMEESMVIVSVLESLSENYLDSVVAPLFFAFLFGPLGALAFRVINTLDAIWGYKNEKYWDFGFFPAKTDDVLAFLPARLSALLMIAAALLPGFSARGAVRTVLRDSRAHHSPNSGFPEAAAAGALGVGFGGSVVYFGKVVENPSIGEGRAKIGDIKKIIVLNYASTILLILPFLFI